MSCTTDVCGVGNWTGPKPGDPDNNAVLSANGTFGGIEVSWTYPNTNSHAVAHTLLYRSIGDSFETAIQHAIVSGNRYFDKDTTDPIRTYYYWIQFVSINGTVLNPIGPATGYALDEIDKVITGMAGRIEAGLLATSLRSRIDTIATLERGVTDLDTKITDETGVLATTLLGVKSDVDDALAYFAQEREARLTTEGALATAINTTVAKAKEDLYAAIQEETDVRASETGDLSGKYAVKVDLAGNVAGFGLASSGNVYDGTIHSEFGIQADSFWISGPTTVSNTAPTTDLYHGRVWVDSSVTPNVTKWFNKNTGVWQTSVVKGAAPFIVRTTPDPETGAPAGVYIDSAYIETIKANQIDSRGLSIKDQDGNVILAAGTSLDWSKIAGQGKPADGATVGAEFGVNINGQIKASNASTYIDNAAINSALIGELNAEKITSGTISAGRIDVTRLSGSSAEFTNPGNYSYTVPAGYTSIALTIDGAGGGGGSGATGDSLRLVNNSTTPWTYTWTYRVGGTGGAGGRGGRYIVTLTGVSPGTVISITIPNGGQGGASVSQQYQTAGNAGTAGGTTSVAIPGVGTFSATGGGGGGGGQLDTTLGSASETGPTGSVGTSGIGGGSGSNGSGGAGGIGGAGTSSNASIAGVNGSPGRVLIECYNGDGVIARGEWSTLMTHLNNRFTSWTWP